MEKEKNAPVAVNINGPVPVEQQKNELVQAEQIVSLYQSILGELETEKEEINDVFNDFCELVFNGGDSTSSSKEAVVNLLTLRSNLIDKKTKIFELFLKTYQKDGPKVNQYNDIHITDKRKLFAQLDQEQKNENDI